MKVIGKTARGGTSFDLSADTKRVARYNVPVATRIVKLSIYVDGLGSGTGDQVMCGVIYDAAGALIAQGDEVTILDGQAAGWVDLPFLGYPGGVPVLAALYDFGVIGGANTNSIRLYGDDPGSGAITGALPLTTSGNEITDPVRAANASGDGRPAESSTGIWEAATNLIGNGGFETNATHWGATANATVTRDNAQAKFGGWSLKVVTNGVGTNEGSQTTGPLSKGAVTPGAVYAVSMWVYSAAGGEQLHLNVDETDASSGYLRSWPIPAVVLAAGWQRLSFVNPAGGSCANLVPNVRTSVTPQAITIWIDGVQVEQRVVAAGSVTLSGNEITDVTRKANTQGDGRAFADGSMGIWEGATNLCTNGGFETNLTGWASLRSATVTRITSDFKFGSSCAQVVTPGVQVKEGHISTNIAIAANTPYTLSTWVKAPAGARLQLYLDFYTGARVFDSSILTSYVGTGAWERVSVSGTSPAGANSIDMYLCTSSVLPVQAITFTMDGVQLEATKVATPYVHTNGATAARAASRAQAPASVLNSAQGWVAVRMRMGFASADSPINNAYAFSWGVVTGEFLYLRRNLNGGGRWEVGSYHGGVLSATVLSGISAWNVGDLQTVIIAWTATTLSVSVNGAAFVSAARSAVAAPADALFEIGRYSASTFGWLDGDVLWLGAGTGTLTNADATTVNGLPDREPTADSFPGTPSFFWDGQASAWSGPGAARNVATPYVHTDGATVTRNAGRVQAPAVLLDETQGWVAMRLRLDFSHSMIAGNFVPTFFQWADSSNAQLRLTSTSAGFQALRWNAGNVSGPVVNMASVAGDLVTLVMAWDATTVKLSVNGGAFVSMASAAIPVLANTLFDIGKDNVSTRWADSDFFWFAAGAGALTAGAPAIFNGFGNADPSWSALPGSPTMLWAAADSNYIVTQSGRMNIDTYADGASNPFGANTPVDYDLSVFGTYVSTHAVPSEDEFYYARLPFDLAQKTLDTGKNVENSIKIANCGWHGTRTDRERGSFVLVNSDGPLADLVGERLRITSGRGGATIRSVVAYCHTRASIKEDLSIPRRLFFELAVPGDATEAVEVEVIA